MTAEDLLQLHPLRAIKIMAAKQYGKPATPDWFVVKKVFSNKDKSIAEVELEFNELFVPLSHRYDKSMVFKVKMDKLDLNLLGVGGPIEIALSVFHEDKSYKELVSERYNYTNMVFTDDDFDADIPNVKDTVLRASDKSLRWFGEVPVKITMMIEKISKYIRRSDVIVDYNSSFTKSDLLFSLVDGLNKSNSTELPVLIDQGSVSYVTGNPIVIGNEIDRVNTAIDLRFAHPYSGDLRISYNRRSFHKTYGNPVVIKGFGTLSMNDVLSSINKSLGVTLEMEELEPFTIPTEIVRGEVQLKEGKYRLMVKGNSLVNVGEIWIQLVKDYLP